jgi:membrane-associated phospholipid phosphatase
VVLGGNPTPDDRVAIPLRWTGPRFGVGDYVVTGTGAAVTLAAAIVHPLSHHLITGGILFDDAARSALRVNGVQARYAFRDASNVELSLAATWPFFVDALGTAWWYRGSRDVAQQMTLLGLETLAVAGAAQGVTNVLVSRQRPYGQYCGTAALPSSSEDCSGTEQYRSFFSGHATFTFAAAALICVEHSKFELLGPPWDALSCASGYLMAASTSTFRVMADMHYVSDVVTGALVGTLVGYGVPLLHFKTHLRGEGTTGGVHFALAPSSHGAAVLGTF